MTRGNLSLAIPVVALLMLAIGVVNEPQNAYAGAPEEPHCSEGETSSKAKPVVTSIVPTIDGAIIEWTQAEWDKDKYGNHKKCSFPDYFEIEVDEAPPVNSPFLFEDEEIPGGAGGEYTLEGLECETTYYFDIDGLWGSKHKDGADEEFTTLACEPEEDHGQVVEVHCDVVYDWEMFIIFGEREGYGECTYVYEDDYEQHEEVEIGGGFISFSGDLFGTFDIMDYDYNDLYLDEVGTVDVGCEFETEEEYEGLTPYCLETEMVVTGGSGIFDDLDGEGERTAYGFFETYFIFSEGHAYSTVWIFFDCPECVPEEETKKNGGGCSNCQQPSIGVNERGLRVVDGGLTVNGRTIDADFYHTEFPLIQANILTPIDFVFKIWDDRENNIKHVQVQLGKNKVGESFNQVGSATWDRNVMTKVATVTHDPMFKNVHMERHADQDCKVGGTPCTIIHVRLTPTVAIVGDVVFGVNIWDDGKNTVTSFFNDGIQIGTEADIVVEEPIDTTVYKVQERTDGGLGNIDKRYSEAFQMKLDWHNANIDRLVDQLGY